MAYTLSSHTSVPSLTTHHHLEAAARTVPGVLPRVMRVVRVRKAGAVLAFAPFARGRGGSIESTGSLSGGAAVEERTVVILARAVAWVVHLLGLVGLSPSISLQNPLSHAGPYMYAVARFLKGRLSRPPQI